MGNQLRVVVRVASAFSSRPVVETDGQISSGSPPEGSVPDCLYLFFDSQIQTGIEPNNKNANMKIIMKMRIKILRSSA